MNALRCFMKPTIFLKNIVEKFDRDINVITPFSASIMALAFFALTTASATSYASSFCLPPNIPLSNGGCQLVTTEEVLDLDIADLIDANSNPFPPTYDAYDAGDAEVFVQGAPPENARLAVNWSFVDRPAFETLREQSRAIVADQLGVPNDDIVVARANGLINALMFIRISKIGKKPAEQRDAFEQQLFDEVERAFQDRRRHIATLASNYYNSWRDNPCSFQIPVGDDPDAYLRQTGVESYCLASEFGNSLVLALTTTPAIPAENYLYWANVQRMQGFNGLWANILKEGSFDERTVLAKDAYAKAYLSAQQGMGYHQAWGTLGKQPSFDFNEIYSGDPSAASQVQSVINDFAGAYARDFLGSVLVGVISKGFVKGVVPDPHDIAVLAAALTAFATTEIIDQRDSREGVENALLQSNDPLEAVLSDNAISDRDKIAERERSRAELILMLIELSLPEALRALDSLPDFDRPNSGLFYVLSDPDEDKVRISDWGLDLGAYAASAEHQYSDQSWMSRSLGNVISFGNTAEIYDGFTPSVRHISPNGDFSTAWAVRGRTEQSRQFLVTRYAQLLRDNVTTADTELRFTLARRVNSDCPPLPSYPFNSNPVDYGLSCLILEDNGARYRPSEPNPNRTLYEPVLSKGDNIIVDGRVATVAGVDIAGVNGFLTKIVTKEPIFDGDQGRINVLVRKIDVDGGNGIRTDRFDYLVGNLQEQRTAVFDFSSLPPEITITNPLVTVEATDVLTRVDLGDTSASDPTDGAVSVTNDAPNAFPVGATTVTYTATDADGNSATATQLVNVVDTTPPSFVAVPLLVTVEATALLTPITLEPPQATDLFDILITSDAPEAFTLGLTQVTWTATDASGNTAIIMQPVRVIDTTPPVFDFVPENTSLEATGALTDILFRSAKASDIFDVTLTNDAPSGGLPAGITAITWTATDANGNVSNGLQLVTITDTTAPDITVDQPFISVEAAAVESVVDLGLVSANDLVDGATVVSNDAPSVFPIGDTVVTYTSADVRGNSATATQTVRVVDTTAPVFTIMPEDISVLASASGSAINLGLVEASDIFDVTVSNDAPESFPIGTTVVTWTATDANGNEASITQNVTARYQFGGFNSVVKDGGVYKANRVLPVKVAVMYADNTIASDAKVSIGLIRLGVDNETGEPIEIVSSESEDAGSLMKLRGGSFSYNLRTKGREPGQYRIKVSLDDGSSYSIDVTLR